MHIIRFPCSCHRLFSTFESCFRPLRSPVCNSPTIRCHSNCFQQKKPILILADIFLAYNSLSIVVQYVVITSKHNNLSYKLLRPSERNVGTDLFRTITLQSVFVPADFSVRKYFLGKTYLLLPYFCQTIYFSNYFV